MFRETLENYVREKATLALACGGKLYISEQSRYRKLKERKQYCYLNEVIYHENLLTPHRGDTLSLR